MVMLPFHQAVLVWRIRRELTQEALAHRARLSRPNLSAIERGRRDVSLRTLRAIALGLGIRPGVLADGLPPTAIEEPLRPLSREALERVADAVLRSRVLQNAQEHAVAEALRRVVGDRLRSAGHGMRRMRHGKRAARAAWLWLESSYPPAVIQSLVERITDRQLIRR